MRESGFAGSRRHHLEKLWCEVLAMDSLPQLDRWLSDYFRKNSRYGSRDRRWYSELLFAGARHGLFALFLDFAFVHRGRWQHDPSAIEKEFLAKYSSSNAVLDGWRNVAAERFFGWVWLRYSLTSVAIEEDPGFRCGDTERAFFDSVAANLQGRSDVFSQLLWASVPLWLAESTTRRVAKSNWSEKSLAEFFTKQSLRPPLWLRVNEPEKAQAIASALESEGYEAALLGNAIRVRGDKGIFLAEAYKSGAVEIQDLASQMAGAAVEPRPGDVVWDACAGGGGKTLQIAASLRNRGAVYASDVREFKLEEVKRRARKAGFFNVRCQPWNGLDLPEFPREVQKRGGFDWVLVDAPCTSSGTWRRNPDAKYRVEDIAVRDIVELQMRILRNAARALAPSGRLVYSTCSWFVDEDEAVVEQFLLENPGFECVKMNLHGAPELDADTLFSAVLARKR